MLIRKLPKTHRVVGYSSSFLLRKPKSSLQTTTTTITGRERIITASLLPQTTGCFNNSLSFHWPGVHTHRKYSSTGDASSDKDQDKDVDVDVDETPKKIIQELFDASARGVGQVIFLNNRRSGQILGLGLFLGDPYLAGLAALGTFTATTAATAAGLDKTSVTNGLMGYNGCLVGCALAVFGPPSIIAATTATIVGASATPFVAASLKEAMGSVPQWTFAFNFVTLTSLLRTRPLLEPPSSTTDTETILAEGATDVVVSQGSTFAEVVTSPLTGVSQIFVVQSPLSGAIILGGIGSYSPMLAVHALGGSTMGTVVGAMSGAPLEELTMGLYGFNSALTSMAVGVFFVHSTPTVLLSACGAASTASLFGAMKTVFGLYGAPCLTLPFCFVMSACYLLHKQVPALVLASNPHSPEKNNK